MTETTLEDSDGAVDFSWLLQSMTAEDEFKPPLSATDPSAPLCYDCFEGLTRNEHRNDRITDGDNDRTPLHLRRSFCASEDCDLCRLLSVSVASFLDLGYRTELRGATTWRFSGLFGEKRLSFYRKGGRYPEVGVNVELMLSGQEKQGGAAGGAAGGAGEVRNAEVETARVVGTAELEITTPPGQELPWNGFANARNISPHSGGEDCTMKIKGWLAECLDHHKACGRDAGVDARTVRPKRLLDTGPLDGNPAPRLVDDTDAAGGVGVRYCALSYCWGPRGQNLLTTQEHYQQRKDAIPFEALPRLFQDAVTITRIIGCRYLWIDSLCIIQHDRADWESESPRMHTIYGNASLVIAATHSVSPVSGIFTDRPPVAHFDFDSIGNTYNISVRERIGHDEWQCKGDRVELSSSPLNNRAWAFQERILAHRVVHYTPAELVWECATHIRWECSGTQWPAEPWKYTPGANLKTEIAGAISTVQSAEHGSGAWHGIVSQYTARQLTVESDRLPALSSLARQFAAPQMGRYLAGLWYSQLLQALYWRISSPKRLGGYRAPSWSWASLEGPVRYDVGPIMEELEIIDANCTPAGEDVYGEVSDGLLVVRGQFSPFVVLPHGGSDYDIPINGDEEVWALKLGYNSHNLWYALLLKRSTKIEGTWERVGLGRVGQTCFDGL